jgi:hypothetical protein
LKNRGFHNETAATSKIRGDHKMAQHVAFRHPEQEINHITIDLAAAHTQNRKVFSPLVQFTK